MKKKDGVEVEGYSTDVAGQFDNVPEIANPLVDSVKSTFKKIEQMLYSAPSFVNAVKAALSEKTFQAILSDE